MMDCESGGDPWAYYAGHRGLMQIAPVHIAKVGGDLSLLYDPAVNLRVAYAIWLDSGGNWEQWACRP